jgi:hypothetical protein
VARLGIPVQRNDAGAVGAVYFDGGYILRHRVMVTCPGHVLAAAELKRAVGEGTTPSGR